MEEEYQKNVTGIGTKYSTHVYNIKKRFKSQIPGLSGIPPLLTSQKYYCATIVIFLPRPVYAQKQTRRNTRVKKHDPTREKQCRALSGIGAI